MNYAASLASSSASLKQASSKPLANLCQATSYVKLISVCTVALDKLASEWRIGLLKLKK